MCLGGYGWEPRFYVLVSTNTSRYMFIANQCLSMTSRPDFDSPSVFCRLLDAEKGGYFSIHPPNGATFTTKQQYLPSTNILQTRYINEEGVVDLIDFFPRPKNSNVMTKAVSKQMPYREAVEVQDELKKWLVRRVECIRGAVDLGKDLIQHEH
jgi:GH15 family glucan-1,4-alpha-glucosidase